MIGFAVDAAFAGDQDAAAECISQAEEKAAEARVDFAASLTDSRKTRAAKARAEVGSLFPKEIIQVGLQGTVRMPKSAATTVIATDGSVNGVFPGWGYISATGHWGCAAATQSMPHQAPDAGIAALVAELCAVGMAMNAVPGPATFLVDSQAAIGFLTTWQAGDITRIPTGDADTAHGVGSAKRWERRAARRRETMAGIAALVNGRRDLVFKHVHGHRGHLLNEAADSLAKMASRWRSNGEPGGREAMVESADGLARAFLTSWQQAGALRDPAQVQALLGHASIGTAARYFKAGSAENAAVIERVFSD
jgi:ribonuclease HI